MNILLFRRYTLVGAVATMVHYLVLVTLVGRAGVQPELATAIGATCGTAAAYAGNGRFTFASRVPHQLALPRFGLVAATGAIANGAIVWLGTELLGLHYLVPQIFATAIVLAGGFALNRSWTFA